VDRKGTLRLVFIGASKFGLRCLKLVLGVPNIRVVGVVTSEQSFKISYAPLGVINLLHADFESTAKENDLPLLCLKDSMSEPSLLSRIKAFKPDLFLVVGWYHMIPRTWRELAPAFGLHASLLPDYRGGAPLVWAMINGEKETGITLFQMDNGVDSGPIAAQAHEPIRPDDTIATLYKRIEEHGLEIISRTLPLLAAGGLVLKPQPKSGRGVMPQRSPEDGCIDWNRDAGFIDRWIRAQTRPYPGAFTETSIGRMTIWASRSLLERPVNAIAGLAFETSSGGFGVACGSGSLQVMDWSLPTTSNGSETGYCIMDLVGTVLGGSD